MDLAQRHQGFHDTSAPRTPVGQRFSLARLALAVLLLCAFAGFAALGTWQVQRLHWKTDLMERVNSRVHATPVPAPGREHWSTVSRESDEYRHVQVAGKFLHDRSTLVFASTGLGTGYWVLTPLRTADNTLVLVNRGFVTPEQARGMSADKNGSKEARRPEQPKQPEQPVLVNGLLRLSEPGGGYLRRNDALAGRWYSRDVQAISRSAGLPPADVAPYFIDMDAAGADTQGPSVNPGIPGMPSDTTHAPDMAGAEAMPVAGLTVIQFHNNHLVYALTWYALALMTAGVGVWLVRDDRRRRRMAAKR
jgi:surfeit locus 1 family protein